jgi:MFS family permease
MTLQPVIVATRPRVPGRSRYRGWLAKAPRGQFWLFFAGAILFNFGFAVFFFLFNLYLLDFGRSERTLGLIGSLMAVGSIAGTIPAGIFAERFGLRTTLTGGVVLTVVFAVLRTCVLAEPAQLLLAVLSGMTLCSWAVCLSPAVAALTTEEQRPAAFSLMFASGIGVAGLGGFVAGQLPGILERHPLRTALNGTHATGGALLFGCGVALLALLPFSRLTLRSHSPRARLPRFSNPFLLRFLPAMAIWGLVTGSFAPFANVYFVHHFGLSMQRMGSIFSFSQLVQFVAILCAPLLFRRAGLTSGIMLTQLATAGALALLAAMHTATQAAWIYWAYMAFQCMNEPGIYSLLMDRIPPGEHNGASAATFFVSAASQSIASAAMGAAIVRFGYSPALSVIAGLAVVAAVLFRGLSFRSNSVHRGLVKL